MRTTHHEVTFANPFALTGIDGIHPAGKYRVSTEEEEFSTANHHGYRRVATLISVQSARGVLELHPINPVHLEAALMRDAGTWFERAANDELL